MKTIHINLDEELLKKVDKAIHQLDLKTNRSAFIRESIQDYLERLRVEELENKHRDGYLKFPVQSDEFDNWDEQVWGE